MGTGIYKYVSGKKIELKQSEVKSYIMKQNQWTEAQYNKERYKIKNQIRTLEAFERASGKQVKTQSPVQLLYKEARTKALRGEDYKPSAQMQRIRATTSYGSAKSIQKALSGEGSRTLERMYTEKTRQQFAGLMRESEQARRIFDTIKDPVKREQALSDYAAKVHMKRDEAMNTQVGSIPFGEAFGYEDVVIDLEEYM